MGDGLEIFYKGDLMYSTPDLQFLHYFLADDMLETAKEIFSRMEKDPDWMKKRINEFRQAVKGFEQLGEKLIKAGETFSEKNKQKAIEVYEEFLQRDYEYWRPSIFIDLFDKFEDEIIEFIFKGKEKIISKESLQFLLLPNRSVFWQEKEDFRNIKEYMQKNNLKKTSRPLWEKLKNHANKYWWVNNDYQSVKKLTASKFLPRLDERSENPFWKNISKQKKDLIVKYSLDKKTVERLKQFNEMTYLRDIRKQYTQIANYYIITFFQKIARKLSVPVEWANFIIPFKEYGGFLNKDKKLLKDLELRTRKGVWMFGVDIDWKTNVETAKAPELFELVEGHLKGGNILYGNSASLGKARGKAKIILRQSDFDKFKEGDILITGMTRPEFVPLMKIASAIVTDEGGITCHAAIISRELNKPCVIATQTATKAFKEGDLIEVNANHGYVKLIE
ncbi:hypothetical protein GOV14_05515 [Candidatus Pacearchaeota archaeon]|nr:hypothetical protein [Candidatus Pacearchaeota archaeon]